MDKQIKHLQLKYSEENISVLSTLPPLPLLTSATLSEEVCLAVPSLSAHAHGTAWHEGGSCREEPHRTGCETGGVSEHVASLFPSIKRFPEPSVEPIKPTWLHYLQMVSRNKSNCVSLNSMKCNRKWLKVFFQKYLQRQQNVLQRFGTYSFIFIFSKH